MKKITTSVLLFALFLCYTTNFMAQETIAEEDSKRKKVSFIPTVGIGMSNVTGEQNGENVKGKTIFSYRAGVLSEIHLKNFSYLTLGLMIAKKGAGVDDSYEDGVQYTNIKQTTHYLQVPIYYTYKVPLKKEGLELGFSVGLYAAYAIAPRLSVSNAGSDFSIDSGASWNKFDMGLGTNFFMDINKFRISLDSEAGFLNIWKKEFFDGGNLHIRTSTFSLSVGYKF